MQWDFEEICVHKYETWPVPTGANVFKDIFPNLLCVRLGVRSNTGKKHTEHGQDRTGLQPDSPEMALQFFSRTVRELRFDRTSMSCQL